MGQTVDAQLSLDPLAPLDPLAAPPLRRRLLSGLSTRLRRLQSLLLPPFLSGRKLKQDLLVESGVMEDPLAAFYDPTSAAFGLPGTDTTRWAVGSELPVPAVDERASRRAGACCLALRVGWLGGRAMPGNEAACILGCRLSPCLPLDPPALVVVVVALAVALPPPTDVLALGYVSDVTTEDFFIRCARLRTQQCGSGIAQERSPAATSPRWRHLRPPAALTPLPRSLCPSHRAAGCP